MTKTIRNLLCAVAVPAALAFGLPAHAAYDLGWDPGFAGDIVINFGPGCVEASADVSCTSITLVSVDFDDNSSREWGINGTPAPLSGNLLFDSHAVLIGADLTIPSADLKFIPGGSFLTGNDDEIPCDGHESLVVSDGEGNHVTFNCTDTGAGGSSNKVTITRVPEPATLALLGLGLSGLALVRRRRLS